MLGLFIERGTLPFYAKGVFDFELQICWSRVQKEKKQTSELKFLHGSEPFARKSLVGM